MDDSHKTEAGRYVVNGLAATMAHYSVLMFAVHTLALSSAALANLFAACVGILVSFLGSKYYVFRKRDGELVNQSLRFVALYGTILLLHTGVMYILSDLGGVAITFSFILATGLQVVCSYFGNKFLVFS